MLLTHANLLTLNEYRLVKGTFNSEAALVKRYSDPISFLKYKLKRVNNLSVSDLTTQDQEYYRFVFNVFPCYILPQ